MLFRSWRIQLDDYPCHQAEAKRGIAHFLVGLLFLYGRTVSETPALACYFNIPGTSLALIIDRRVASKQVNTTPAAVRPAGALGAPEWMSLTWTTHLARAFGATRPYTQALARCR